jgi:NAD(P)H dehydrogenase (quinone)
MIAITGASGQLGRLAIDALLQRLPASEIIAIVRDPAKVSDLTARGVQIRQADYDQPATLDAAFKGVNKLLFISSSEIGKRIPQHSAVIAAAQRSNVQLLAYTSLLHADTSPLKLAAEHQQTEALLRASGLPCVILRNGWYTENYAAAIAAAPVHGVVLGCAGNGRFSTATRADYAAAAAAVLTSNDPQAGRVYELAGDTGFTLSELAAEIARQCGKPVAYRDLSETDYKAALMQFNVPEDMAAMLADADTCAKSGILFDDSRQLSRLIGRPTTPLATSVAEFLKR